MGVYMAINGPLWDLTVLTSIICVFLCYKAILSHYIILTCLTKLTVTAEPKKDTRQ